MLTQAVLVVVQHFCGGAFRTLSECKSLNRRKPDPSMRIPDNVGTLRAVQFVHERLDSRSRRRCFIVHMTGRNRASRATLTYRRQRWIHSAAGACRRPFEVISCTIRIFIRVNHPVADAPCRRIRRQVTHRWYRCASPSRAHHTIPLQSGRYALATRRPAVD